MNDVKRIVIHNIEIVKILTFIGIPFPSLKFLIYEPRILLFNNQL